MQAKSKILAAAALTAGWNLNTRGNSVTFTGNVTGTGGVISTTDLTIQGSTFPNVVIPVWTLTSSVTIHSLTAVNPLPYGFVDVNVSSASTTLTITTGNYTGSMIGSGSLVKVGSDGLTLAAVTLPNITISAGTMLIDSQSAKGNLFVASEATVHAGSLGSLTGPVGSTLLLDNFFGGGTSLAGPTTFNGQITGSGALSIYGSGRILLNGALNSTGGFVIGGTGTLALGSQYQQSASIQFYSDGPQNGGNLDVSAVAGGYHLLAGQSLVAEQNPSVQPGQVIGNVLVDGGAIPGTLDLSKSGYFSPLYFANNLTLGSSAGPASMKMKSQAVFGSLQTNQMYVTGSLDITNGAAIFLTNAGVQTLSGTYPMIHYGSLSGSVSDLSLASPPPGANYSFVNDTAKHVIDLVASPANPSLALSTTASGTTAAICTTSPIAVGVSSTYVATQANFQFSGISGNSTVQALLDVSPFTTPGDFDAFVAFLQSQPGVEAVQRITNLSAQAPWAPLWGDSYDLLVDFNNPGSGTEYLDFGGLEAIGGGTAAIYAVAVPEPSTATLGLMAACALLARRRRA